MANYAYQQLSSTGRPIRLLTLLPACNLEDGLQCHVTTVDLDDNPSYLALSYCWGGVIKDAPISLDDKKTLITTSLSIALRNIRRHFRNDGQGVHVWADAVCINQSDHAERSSQVQMMGDIYSQARQVMLWLGEESNMSDLAMDFIQAMGTGDFSANDQSTSSNLPDFKGARGWVALEMWSLRSVWNRIWILQEFVLPRELILLCGIKSLDGHVLKLAFERWHTDVESEPGSIEVHRDDLHDNLRSMFRMWSLHGAWHTLRNARQLNGETPDIEKILSPPLTLTATDPRDMIYGLLGITKHNFAVDYSRTTRDIYVEFALGALQQGHFSVLDAAGCGLVEPKDRSCALPSWVPDWYSVSKAGFLMEPSLLRRGRYHTAAIKFACAWSV